MLLRAVLSRRQAGFCGLHPGEIVACAPGLPGSDAAWPGIRPWLRRTASAGQNNSEIVMWRGKVRVESQRLLQVGDTFLLVPGSQQNVSKVVLRFGKVGADFE